MRGNLLAVAGSQILDYLAETCVIYIHLCYIYHSGQIVLIAEFPRLLRSYLHAGLSGYHYDGRIRRADRFFYLTDKIKISRGIKNIDLRLFPLDRNQACADRKSTFLLLFIKVAYRTGI